MLPPRYPYSPNKIINNQYNNENYNTNIPFANNKRKSSSKQQNNMSRMSKYQHLKTQQEKRKALGYRKYINQLAQLDYQDKFIELHTKYTMASKVSALKKIKAKNQMAQFLEEQEQQQIGFQQLMDYKYGNKNEQQFYFENNQIQMYLFCTQCDQIHNDHIQVHDRMCEGNNKNHQEYDKKNKEYVYFSLKRVDKSIKRMNGQEYDEMKNIIARLIEIQEEQNGLPNHKRLGSSSDDIHKCLKVLHDAYLVNENDVIFQKICQKVLRDLYKKIR